MSDELPEWRFRTLFISDVHLGARGSQADRLLDFLRCHDADTIYLVGDIVDGWALKSELVLAAIAQRFRAEDAAQGAQGRQDDLCPRQSRRVPARLLRHHFGGIDVVEDTVHTGVDGKRYLVIHGDIFDLVVQNARWLAHLGDKAYDFAIRMNRLVNAFRRVFGVPYWSLSQWAKLKVKNAVNYIGAFEQTLAGRGAASRRRRRDLRPYPPRHDPRRARHPLHELRRLGGKLHCARRARGRPVRDHHLDRPAAAGRPVAAVAARAA